jgi:NAD(P)-dependent dehydrogenase (short-subunit alcohol dehydrogenase family)
MNASLANKTFCITGAAAGIGLSTARHFLANGASVGLSDFNERALFELHSSLDESQRSRVYIQALDVANRGQVKEFLHATKKQFGRIDGIANIAGTPGKSFGVHEIWEIPTEEYDRVMDTNVRGTFNFLAESLVPGLLEEPASIVTIGSVASLRGYNRGAIYSTSKHAIIGLTKSAAMEGGSRSIRVNAVLP